MIIPHQAIWVKLIVGRPWRLSVGTKSSIEESPRPRRSNSARNLQRLSLRSAFLDSAEATNSLSFSFLFPMVIVFNSELRSANRPVRLLCVSFCFPREALRYGREIAPASQPGLAKTQSLCMSFFFCLSFCFLFWRGSRITAAHSISGPVAMVCPQGNRTLAA